MKASTTTFIMLIALLAIVISVVGAFNNPEDRFCCLCPFCGLRVRGSLVIDPYGKTCDRLAIEMTDPTNESTVGSPVCRSLQDRYRSTCCDANFHDFDTNVKQAPTPSPLTKYPKGNERLCNICIDGSFPSKPQTITAVLEMPGTFTCRDLYYLGLSGNIPTRLCYPLQDYMAEPCGCQPIKSSGSSTNSSVAVVVASTGGSGSSPTGGVVNVKPPTVPAAPAPMVRPVGAPQSVANKVSPYTNKAVSYATVVNSIGKAPTPAHTSLDEPVHIEKNGTVLLIGYPAGSPVVITAPSVKKVHVHNHQANSMISSNSTMWTRRPTTKTRLTPPTTGKRKEGGRHDVHNNKISKQTNETKAKSQMNGVKQLRGQMD